MASTKSRNATQQRIDALSTDEVYTYVLTFRRDRQLQTTFVPVKVIDKEVPLPGLVALYGVRVERLDTGEQLDVHVKDVTRTWADTVDLEDDEDELRAELTAMYESRFNQMRGYEIPDDWRVRVTKSTNASPEDNIWFEVEGKPYVLVSYESTYSNTMRVKPGWHSIQFEGKAKYSNIKVLKDGADGPVKAPKKVAAAIEEWLENMNRVEHRPRPPHSISAFQPSIPTLGDEVIDRAIEAINDGKVVIQSFSYERSRTLADLLNGILAKMN